MVDKETPRGKPLNEPEEAPRHRKHGYRGYPNQPGGPGDVHSGSGFGGAGSVSRSGNPIDSSVISERTREDVKEEEEDEK